MDKYQWTLDYEQALDQGCTSEHAAGVADCKAVERAADAIDHAEMILEDR